MKIVSKFHDYYDSCLAYGQDTNVVYLRDTKSFKFNEKNNPPIIQELEAWVSKLTTRHSDFPFSLSRNRPFDWFVFNKLRYTVNYITLIFSGRAYPAIEVLEESSRYPFTTKTYLWTAENAIEYFVSRGQDLKSTSRFARQNREELLRQYYKCIQPNLDWMIENKVTCVLFSKEITVNPSLKDIQFYKVYNSYQCYQELDIWISGTLAYPQNMMVEIEDKYRIEQHGFDTKYGFRKRPTK